MKFLRRDWNRYFKLGRKKKKKQKWRRPTGRDNKMREKRKGYPAVVSVGYKKNKETYGKIKDKYPVLIRNPKELDKVNKKNIIIVGKVGKKKKTEIIKKAKSLGLEIYKIDPHKFLEKMTRKENESKT